MVALLPLGFMLLKTILLYIFSLIFHPKLGRCIRIAFVTRDDSLNIKGCVDVSLSDPLGQRDNVQ